jgi:hypothetical protein
MFAEAAGCHAARPGAPGRCGEAPRDPGTWPQPRFPR